MASYFSGFRTCRIVEDAPLEALPESEASALTALQARTKHTFSSPHNNLHPEDPWRTLTQNQVDLLLLRFLRYNLLQVESSFTHVCKVAAWRTDECPWNFGLELLQNRKAGVPILSDVIRGRDDEVLLFIPCRHYDKSIIDRKLQTTAIKAFFESYLYATGGLKASSAVMLVDFSGLHLKQVDLTALKNSINIFLSYYPEVLQKVILVNYPRWIHGTWKCVLPLLDARTVAKIVWVRDSTGLRSELRKYFDHNVLPMWLDGNAKNGTMRLFSGTQLNPEECRAKLWA
ncbi:unnamed protein product [Agarophyton chilense]|eukprot:gb/GEZJ01003987.1/.p1 GENE.gb/GEZJ01003987.1/~~gb/GEZJ01003987.1/.p1  ORF type:complete len:287 (+),score=31.33 gb/GEZJ01003987.1/:739-1599(+)